MLGSAVDTHYEDGDATHHAVMNLLRDLSEWGLNASKKFIVVNGEPCSMCSSALIRVGCIVCGASAESSMDPYIPLAMVVSAAKKPPLVVVRLMRLGMLRPFA